MSDTTKPWPLGRYLSAFAVLMIGYGLQWLAGTPYLTLLQYLAVAAPAAIAVMILVVNRRD